MAILYIVSILCLWTGIVLIPKSKEETNLTVWIICGAILIMCFQALTAGICGITGISITLFPITAGNLLMSFCCGWQIRKRGLQKTRIYVFDIISVIIIFAMIMVFSFKRYGEQLDVINFVSSDSGAHARWAITVAEEHILPLNMYFSSLNTGLIMQVYAELTGTGRFDWYRMFILCEIIYTALSALLFWALLRVRCPEGKWQKYLLIILTPIYWAGYPVYSTLFGFSYLGVSVNLITVMLLLLDFLFRETIDRRLIFIGFNLVLYGVIVCYTLFVPSVFFGCFTALAWQMVKKSGLKKTWNRENILTMLSVFLLPTVLGLIYSFSNIQLLSPSGVGIMSEGGCYSDIYSNFIILTPFAVIGIYFLIHRKNGGYLLPAFCVHLIMMGIFFAGLLMRRVSDYYYVRNNSILWLFIWLLITEGIWGMMERCKAAVLFPFFFYGLLFMGKYADGWIEKANRYAIQVKTWNYCDLILINNTYFNFSSPMTPELMELYRYADEHFELGEVVGVHAELEKRWFQALTKQERNATYESYEDFLEMLQEEQAHYICAEYSAAYITYEEFLDKQEVVFENDAGKIFRIVDQ